MLPFGYIPPSSWKEILTHPIREIGALILGQDNIPKRLNAQRTFELLDIKSTDTVLDFGAGPALYSCEMAKLCKHVTAFDITDAGWKWVTQRNHPSNLTFITHSASSIPFTDHSFDAILMAEVLTSVPDMEKALNEAWRVLRPGGRLLVTSGQWLNHLPRFVQKPYFSRLLHRAVQKQNVKDYGTPTTEAKSDVQMFFEAFVKYHHLVPQRYGTFVAEFDALGTKVSGASPEISYDISDHSLEHIAGLIILHYWLTGKPSLRTGQALFIPLMRLLDKLSPSPAVGVMMGLMRKPKNT